MVFMGRKRVVCCMKKLIAFVFALICVLGFAGCNIVGTPDKTEINQIFSDVEKVEVCIGESKFYFNDAEEVKNICGLFENIVGKKVPDKEEQAEGFYEITFSKKEKETHVIFTGSTIMIDGIRYYTTKDVVLPFSEYLVEPTN